MYTCYNTIQNYIEFYTYLRTQVYNTLQSCTQLYKHSTHLYTTLPNYTNPSQLDTSLQHTLQNFYKQCTHTLPILTQLDKPFHNCTQLLHNSTNFYNTWQHSAQLYNSTRLCNCLSTYLFKLHKSFYTSVHDFTMLYICQNKNSTCFTQLYTTLEHFSNFPTYAHMLQNCKNRSIRYNQKHIAPTFQPCNEISTTSQTPFTQLHKTLQSFQTPFFFKKKHYTHKLYDQSFTTSHHVYNTYKTLTRLFPTQNVHIFTNSTTMHNTLHNSTQLYTPLQKISNTLSNFGKTRTYTTLHKSTQAYTKCTRFYNTLPHITSP